MAVIISETVRSNEVIKNKGKLVRVTLKDGRGVKMYEVDAAAAGYITFPKSKQATENKMVKPAGNKQAVAGETKELVKKEIADDLTTIDGIGKATQRILNFQGVMTFEQLKTANIDFLNPGAQAAVERWRNE